MSKGTAIGCYADTHLLEKTRRAIMRGPSYGPVVLHSAIGIDVGPYLLKHFGSKRPPRFYFDYAWVTERLAFGEQQRVWVAGIVFPLV